MCGGERFFSFKIRTEESCKSEVKKSYKPEVDVSRVNVVFIEVSFNELGKIEIRDYDLLECEDCGFTFLQRIKEVK
jgi:hypothetical protein